MARTKQSTGATPSARTTRSSFAVLESMEEDFPALSPTPAGRLGTTKPARKTDTPAGIPSFAAVDTDPWSGICRAGHSASTNDAGAPSSISAAKPAAVDFTAAAPAIGKDEDLTKVPKPTAAIQKGGTVVKGLAAEKQTPVSNAKAGQSVPNIGAVTETPKPAGTPQWADLFTDNRAPSKGIKLKYLPSVDEVVDLSNCVLPSMVSLWGFCLVGCFTVRFPGLEAIYELLNSWGVHCTLKSHNKGWVIFKFKNEQDRTKVFTEGPYNIFGRLLILKMLSEDFTFDDEAFLKVPIWVKLPNLPLNLWNEEAMSKIASKVGVPITTDKVTQEMSNYNFARVLIEVDLTLAPCLSVPIRLPSGKTFNQAVIYETFPNFCFHCKSYGHHPFICNELGWKKVGKVLTSGEVKKGVKESVAAQTKQGLVLAQGVALDAPGLALAQGAASSVHGQVTASLPGLTIKGIDTEILVESVEVAVPVALTLQPAATPDATYPTGHCPGPTGSSGQPTSQGTAKADLVGDYNVLEIMPTAQGSSDDECSDSDSEDIERLVMDEKDLRIDDVVVKVVITKGKAFKFHVKPFKFVHMSVVRVDTSLRLTDDLDGKSLTFVTKCLEAIPGVTKKKGEICFDSRFTSPFRAFFGA